MRKIFAILLVGLVAGVCVGGPKSTLTSLAPLELTDVSTGTLTNAADTTTGPAKVRGYVEMIYIQVSGTSTVDVDIVTTNVVDSGWPERTLYSADNITANSTFVTNNAALRYVMYDEKVIMRAYAATPSNQTVRATVILSKE